MIYLQKSQPLFPKYGNGLDIEECKIKKPPNPRWGSLIRQIYSGIKFPHRGGSTFRVGASL
jgi:hypothetical protein